jgi:hypothetical protein
VDAGCSIVSVALVGARRDCDKFISESELIPEILCACNLQAEVGRSGPLVRGLCCCRVF